MMTNKQTAGPPVDLSIMTEIAGKNREMITTLVKHLLAEYPIKIDEMRKSIAAKDPEQLAATAHKLKGTVVSYGAQHAHDLVFSLEKMAKDNLLDQALETLENLKQEFSRIEEYLQANYL